jgi:hypothetical protein
MPGAACLTTGSLLLRGGSVLIPDEVRGHPTKPGGSGPRFDELSQFNDVTYGDLDGDGRDEAVVPLWCNNNGGTASGALLYSLAMFSARAGAVHFIGLITPKHQPVDELPTLLSDPRVSAGQVVVNEALYGPHDGTCCPSGRATTTWTYSDGQLRVATSTVTSQPH